MRWLVGMVLLLGLVAFGGYVFLKGYPYGLYSTWIRGMGWNSYYQISNFKQDFLKPTELETIPPYQEDYVQLWKTFQIGNSVVPLPTRHPLFITVPILDLKDKDSRPTLGMIFLSSGGRELSRLYILPMSYTQDHSLGQELFKLPFVKNRILKKDREQVWKDIFSHVIKADSKTMDEMIHDLYILHLRSKLIPPNATSYGLLPDGKVLVELDSPDKDYKIELVMKHDSGSVYSYILKTEIRSEESQKLRSKFLSSVAFAPVDPSMGKILYTEFKQLNYARQVDQEGMLYLFAAWSQEIDRYEMLREMVFYLERGRSNVRQLKPVYEYAFKKYGKTFTTKKIFYETEDPELALNRKIEIEKIEKTSQAARAEASMHNQKPELTADEKMNLYLKKAKEDGPLPSDDMTIH